MNLKQTLDAALSTALDRASGESGCQALVAPAKNPQFGDYQANGVMALAKRLGRNPRELGAAVVAQFERDPLAARLADKLELAGPGFINIFLKAEFLGAELDALHEQRLMPPSAAPQTIVIDYSSPNLAKEMHVGHLRGTIIGDAIARTFDYLGHHLIRQNHFGDWGTQFGMLIAYMEELPRSGDLHTELSDLESFYRAAKQRFDADPAFATLARANVVKLQAGDPECLALWRRFIAISIEHCQALYDKLGITLGPEHIVPESFYNERLEPLVADLKTQGLLSESDGAECVFLDEFKNKNGEPLPVIVQKSDGGYLYATTDLAAIRYRCQELHAERVLYLVDARQSLHFQQVFAVARKAGYAPPECQLEHLSYGTMMGKDGKPFKTRSGDTIKLVDLCGESIERAHALVREKNPQLGDAEQRQVAATVGIAAVKYADLSKNRNSDYIFDWDTMLSFEGNTAPYLLYAYARIRSIFRRAGLDPDARYPISAPAQAEEKTLALKLLQFSETIETLAQDCLPNQLCLYLYELAGHFMKFYEACPVLKAEGKERDSRLGLCQLSARTLRQGLALLGIDTLEQM
ncbi:MAG: arginine--tRNA ligase [Pseudomonadales bacterium]|jgi:arginyl-tRNA synthetase|nr:arginine--tRNA ligase [Pseudomonadales bacterium]